nr:PepSY-associated TM helix domain-containing protein [Stakelama flava]
MYKEVHGWVGIISGLALFIAFFAGALTMFEQPIARWASAPVKLAPPPSLAETPKLVEAVLKAHPEAAKNYTIHLTTGPDVPGRVSWSPGPPRGEHGPQETFYAGFAADGTLQVTSDGPSPVADFIDILHQQVGLPFSHDVSMPIMGAIALLYVIALVSGVIILLPKIVRELFTVRVGSNVKRMWLDVHNVLGVLSLPFHLIMALTSVVFAFHDQFYDAQSLAFSKAEAPPARSAAPPSPETRSLLTPVQAVKRIKAQAPGFTPIMLTYGKGRGGAATLLVRGTDPRYAMRGPAFSLAFLDPYDGRITGKDYMPGMQDGWGATITSFFALHFGSFGGVTIRWAYFLLGMAGAFLFYTGNLLWIESRRRKERKAGAVVQTRATRILASLTLGIPLGCVSGIAISMAGARLGLVATYAGISALYYLVFIGITAWALMRGAAKSGGELLLVTAAAIATVSLSDLCAGGEPAYLLNLTALSLAAGILILRSHAVRRSARGPRDSVWSARQPLSN